MNIIQIIEQEIERNPKDWKRVVAQRIEAAYKKNGTTYVVREYNFTNVATLILTALILAVMIVLGSMLFV